jgi:hypothetical protein
VLLGALPLLAVRPAVPPLTKAWGKADFNERRDFLHTVGVDAVLELLTANEMKSAA